MDITGSARAASVTGATSAERDPPLSMSLFGGGSIRFLRTKLLCHGGARHGIPLGALRTRRGQGNGLA